MTLKIRFALLLGLLLVGFGLTLVVLHRLERNLAAQSLADERQNRELLLNHWLDLADRALPQLAADYAEQEVLTQLDRDSAVAALREKVSGELQRTGLQGVWLLDSDGTTVMQIGQDRAPRALPISAADFKALVAQTPNPRFYTELSNSLVEVCARHLHPAAAVRPGQATWVIVTRVWDQSQLDALASLTGGAVSLAAPSTTAVPAKPTDITLLRPLPDWQGHTVRLLRVDYRAPELDRLTETNGWQVVMFVAFGLLVLAAMWLALQAWVLRPLTAIGTCLAREDRAAIQPLRAEPGELGTMAQLVATSFEQRAALQREIEERHRAQEALEKSEAHLRRTMDERTRLGRDLHDGVIQSLYAAGMGLTSIRSQLQPDQIEAATRLEQTRGALNETIHDLRNFINGLEPESLKMQSFTQAVTALLEVVQGLRPLQTAIAIDESLALQLTLAQRVHALQIAREAVSNALRHGEAGRVTIALRPAGENVEFEVTDDGRGFDPAAATAHGLGLANFTERARELGAELTVTSAPGKGARVRLVFSLFQTL